MHFEDIYESQVYPESQVDLRAVSCLITLKKLPHTYENLVISVILCFLPSFRQRGPLVKEINGYITVYKKGLPI